MSKFYVGQRVRYVSRMSPGEKAAAVVAGRTVIPGVLGETGTISRLSDSPGKWFVVWDCGPSATVFPYQIEPISNVASQQLGSWEALKGIYQPRVTA